MSGKLDEAKDELLARAADVAAHRPGAHHERPEDALWFLRLYYRHVAAEDLLGRDPLDVYGSAVSHRGLAEERPQGGARVRAYTPTLDEHGWESGHSVVDVVTDDMPFLVDSVTMELNRHEAGIHLIVHPQLAVRRDVTGRLTEVCGSGKRCPEDAAVESWMHVEIDRQADPEALGAMESDLTRVLGDVRAAVEDWPKMRDAALGIAEGLASDPPPLPTEQLGDGEELLRWLAGDHFTFLGYREYRLEEGRDGDVLRAVSGTGLGILRGDRPESHSFAALPPEVRAKAREKQLLVLTKANSRATVHRPAYLDYVGVKTFDEAGEVAGERRFLGLLTHVAYSESITRIPVARRKLEEVLERADVPADSHDGKDLAEILENYPRDELLQTSAQDLLPIALGVLRLQERRQLKLFLRRDDYGRYMSCLVYLPRDRYTTSIRLRIQDILLQAFRGTSIDYTTMVSESVLARLHFVVRGGRDGHLPQVDADELEERLAQATRSWGDDLADAVVEQCGEARSVGLLKRYNDAFPEAFKEDFPARTAVADLKRLEGLTSADEIAMNLYEPYAAAPGERRFKVYRVGEPISLSNALPLLQRMGVEVIDERPYELDRRDDERAWIYDFGLRYEPSREVQPDRVKRLFQDAFAAQWRGEVESDGFNALVPRAGLDWRQATVLRAYCKYLRQAGSTFSQNYIERTLLDSVHIATLLVRLFEARLDPRHRDGEEERSTAIIEEIEGCLDEVASLDQDRILRAYLRLIRATLRTNYFQAAEEGRPKAYLSIKLDPRGIPELPRPRPRYEIFVYSPRTEGVHLRFGPVARGGIRWSDRREDFRTEILGLAKAQMVKNAVIVPVGSKGGFVVKRPPVGADREALQQEGIACYRELMCGMLDITDNLAGGSSGSAVVPPADVVRHDGDDPYLVVAADKGTAAFSDLANSIAREYGYWLGDAFASGGSTGYDHKEMAITAKGAWESVRYHFRELGVDVQGIDGQGDDVTVVGIGDMSGDVFGGGMLLSRHIKLVAAFDHRHVFIDPDPDPETGYRERERLHGLPRSSWADYDTSLISAGGGVHPRTAKQISISPQARAALGIDAKTETLAPYDLIRAILSAPVDLLWNGGIGTFVKASTESNADVGDKTGDQLRVDGRDLRCRVVGEGGNLGFTQLGRIEYALSGGLINTDFIDNSAGVDTSDHEVNIKILLDQVVADGDMTDKQRVRLLHDMTDEVAELVLRDNDEQNLAIACTRAHAAGMLHVHTRYLARLERDGVLDRELEFLPGERTITERRSAGLGLTSPEICVLLSHTKIGLAEELLDSDLPDDPALAADLASYFPAPLRERFRSRMDAHPLGSEIIATRVVNDMVNYCGTTFAFRLGEETGASAADIARAYLVAREIFDMPSYSGAVEGLQGQADTETQTTMLLEGRKLTERATRWLLHNRRPPFDIQQAVEAFADGVCVVLPHLPKLLVGGDLTDFEARRDEFAERGVPDELSERAASLVPAYSAMDIVETARVSGRPCEEVAEVYFDLAESLKIAPLRDRVVALPRDDRWQAMARSALRDDLYAAHAALTRDVLAVSEPGSSPEERLGAWIDKNDAAVSRAKQTLSEIWASDTFDLATLSVAVRVVRTLVASSTLPEPD
ncbi:MAG: NAD-glutamate dehydrogenase [Streptosporangiaceae bacterium]